MKSICPTYVSHMKSMWDIYNNHMGHIELCHLPVSILIWDTQKELEFL
jgi:hypothetical protein